MTEPDIRIGDSVLDALGNVWTVLNRPDWSGVCDGLFRAEDGSGRQMYGEHVPGPWTVWGPA